MAVVKPVAGVFLRFVVFILELLCSCNGLNVLLQQLVS